MTDVKRSWAIYLVVAMFAIGLAVLGLFQYQWQVKISEADVEKSRVRVREQTERFAADFNREIQSAYFNFQTDADVWKTRDWNAFAERFEYWSSNTAYPSLIADLYYLDADASAPPLRYDRSSRTFQTAEISADIEAMRGRTSDVRNFNPVDVERLALYLPIRQAPDGEERRIVVRVPRADGPSKMRLPPPVGHLAIKLDPQTLKGNLTTDLKQKYFGDGEFDIAITDSAGNPIYHELAGNEPDASAALFDLSPDKMVLFHDRAMLKAIGAEKREATVINSKVESQSITRKEVDGSSRALSIEMKREGLPRTSVFTTTIGGVHSANPWTLSAQHTAGSIDSFAASTLRRNLALGFGLIGLLAAAIAVILLYSIRARRLAERQLSFVSSVSHEFRTPLAVISSAGENLADGVASEQQQVARYGNLVKSESRKLSAMVEQILEFAGAKSGRRKFSFATSRIADVVDQALAECQPLIDEQGMTVERNIEANLPDIKADASALSQALQNLIANSIKYANGNAWLRVSATNGDGIIKLAVEDRGIGISRGDLKQIFQPFFRSKEVVDAQIHGNGLGLSLVKQIVDAHGGSIKAQSEPGKGSKFTIEINADSAR